jgi:hypothetical protein
MGAPIPRLSDSLDSFGTGEPAVRMIERVVHPDARSDARGASDPVAAEPEDAAVYPDVGHGRSGRPYNPPAIVAESPTFPMDAFIIPEGTARLPRGVGEDVKQTWSSMVADAAPSASSGVSVGPAGVPAPNLVDTAPLALREEGERRPRSASLREQRAHDVADRLEALATQLRHHGYEVLAQKSVRGDALDALLAGVIAGYLVAAE